MAQLIFDFSEENYIVVGASSGIGKETALRLASVGACVLAVGRNKERLRQLYEYDEKHIVTASVDVKNIEDLEAALKNFVQAKGKLKGGVYSAGFFEYTPVKSYDKRIAEQTIQVDFLAAMEFLKLILKPKYIENAASIVLLSSVAAFTNEKGSLFYSAMKAAINSAVKTAAKEIAPKGIRINSICPGFINSPMTEEFLSNNPLIEQRHLLGLGKAEDVANVALFLLSDAARRITGTNIIADGGYTA